ncbi:MAG TPA: hypothetical protein VGE40_02535, partial [Bacilli bacterium]
IGAAHGYIAEQKPQWDKNQYDFYEGRITVEQFLEEKAKLAKAAIDKLVKDGKYDLDPKTNP